MKSLYEAIVKTIAANLGIDPTAEMYISAVRPKKNYDDCTIIDSIVPPDEVTREINVEGKVKKVEEDN